MVFLALSLLPVVVLADDASEATAPPPAIYNETIAKLLTPANEVLKKEADYSHLQGDAISLLDETITYVTEDGKRVSVYHTIEKALNDAGVKAMAQDSLTYKKKVQHAYLVLAQTIQPDGSKDPVKSDAVFLKNPQDEADDSIYDDEVDLVTVYSNVKPGSITENITVVVDTEPKIPDQYSETYTWVGSWPEYLQRFVVDLPQSYADRLKVTNLGPDVPTPTKLSPSPGRQRLTWEKLSTPAEPAEDSAAPPDQIGPLVWVSTLESWDAFAAWYNSLLKGSDVISPELKTKIDGWTKDARDPEQILRILHEHVARDVRYTGFELGKSDLQPHDCMSVWQRQYGDCKDKANLLRAMLAYKGISSWLTLLDTEHAGLINQANPDYRQFDHCIVYAQIGDKNIFCDPTITYGEPGMLDGSESDRNVLVIKDGKADWVHTPSSQDSTLSYSFDLQLHANGELSGWVEMKAGGYYSASYEEKYRELTKDQVLSEIQDEVRTFFPNSTVADVDPLKASSPPGERAENAPPFSVRAYMILTGVLNQGDGSTELKFPEPDYFLPDISDYKTRRHASFLWPDFSRVTARIQLPAGWSASMLPSPFLYDSPSANFQANWSTDKDALTANCAATIKQSLFSCDAWQTLGDAVTNLKSWCSKTLILTKSKDGQAATTPPQTDSDLVNNLPVMPTGEGELNLIDSEFPSDGNVAARRVALGRIPALFPSDQQSIVEAAIKLASLDLDDGKWSDVINRLQPIENANRAVLDADTIAWADYNIASALEGENKKAEARTLFQKIAENGKVNAFRRGWAVYEVTDLMADSSPKAALDYADQGLDLDSDSSPSIYALYATTAITHNFSDRLKDRLTKLIAAKPQNLEDILLEVTNSAQTLIEGGNKKAGLELVSLLESLSDPATTGDAFARAVKKVRDGADSLASYAKLQQDLKQALAQFPDIAALEKKQPQFASAGDAEKAASQHVDSNESDEALGCALRLTTGYPVDEHFSAYYWDCVNYAEWCMRNSPGPSKEPFFFKLAEMGAELPHTCDAYADTELLQAKVREGQGRRRDAAAIYDLLAREPSLADGYQSPLALRSGTNWEELGDYVKALSCYQTAEKLIDTEEEAQEAALRAAFIQFDNGNKAEAFRLVNLLAQAAQKGRLKPGEQVGDVIVLAKDAPALPAFWDNWQAWWPQWQQIESEAGLDPVKDHKVVPIIAGMFDFGKELGTAKNDKDTKQFFELMRQLAYAARFYPNAAEQFVEVFSDAEEVLPDHANDFRLLAISILNPLAPTEPAAQRARILQLMINLVDSNQSGKALDLMAREWKPALEDSSEVSVAIHRVWGLAAINQHQDLDKVASALENDLKASADTARSTTDGVLSDVYAAMGRQPDAVKLLETELANPAITADSSAVSDLKTRLDNIQSVAEASKQLAAGVAAWLKDHQPSWWDYAEPKTVDDPRLGRLDELLKDQNNELQPAEWVKAGLMAPSVATLSQDTQEQAVLKAYTTLLDTMGSQDDANALAHSIIDNSFFPTSLKTNFLYSFLLDAYGNHQKEAFTTFLKLPIYQAMSDAQKAVMDRFVSFTQVDTSSSAAIKGYMQNLSRQPMDALGLGMAEDSVANLLQLGDIDSAKALYDSASNYTMGPNAGMTKPEFQLTLLKEINQAGQLQPVIEALSQATLSVYKPETIVKPATFDQRRKFTSFADLPEEDATKFRLYLLKLHPKNLNLGLQFWFEFMQDLKHTPGADEVKLSLIKAGLENASDDDTRAILVRFGSAVLDIDNPSLRQNFLVLLQPYRDPLKFPQTSENIRMFDTLVGLRTGKPLNLDTDLDGFTNAFNSGWAADLKICALLQARDLSRLKDTLNGFSADQMMSPMILDDVVPALEAVGMKDEAALARDTLTKKMHQDLLSVWFTHDGNDLQTVVEDLTGLDSTQDVPKAFTDFVKNHLARQQPVLRFQLCQGYLDKDWNATSALGAAYTQTYPDDYVAFWFLGRSLAELGKKDDAIKALTVYCQYSKNEIWYPDAKELLAKLSATSNLPN